MPAQPLLRPAALVDEIVAVVDQQLQLPVDLLVGPRPAQVRLAQRRACDRERVDRVRLAARPAGPSLRHRQLRRHPHQLLTRREQLPLQPARQLPAVLDRPQPLARRAPPPSRAARRCRPATVCSSSIRPASSTATAVTDCLCTSTPITIISIASTAVGGDRRADRPQSRRKPRSYQVTLDGLGRRRRHNAGKSALGRHSESSQPPPPESAPAIGRRHPARMTLSSGMSPDPATGK